MSSAVSTARPSAAQELRIAPRHGRSMRRHVDNRMAEWERHASARRALMRARVKRKNARTKIAGLEAQLAIQRAHEADAMRVVLDLWPKLPPEQRGVFSDDLDDNTISDASRERECNGESPAPGLVLASPGGTPVSLLVAEADAAE